MVAGTFRRLLGTKTRKRGLALVGTTGLLALGFAGLIAARADDPIGEGDSVRFHWSVERHRDGALLYASDPEVARAALDEGNPYLDPNLSSRRYRAAEVEIELRDVPFQISRFLMGHRPGDVVQTPFVVDAAGHATEYTLPATIGPLATEFTVNRSRVPESASSSDGTEAGPRDLRVGDRFPYAGILEASVVSVDEDSARVRVDVTAPSGQRLHSKVLGLDVTYEVLPNGSVVLRPQAEPGQVFTTRGCKLPLDIIPPGRYRVMAVGDDGILVRHAPEFHEHLLDETLRFELRVLSVDHWPRAHAAAGWFQDQAGAFGAWSVGWRQASDTDVPGPGREVA